MRSIRRTILIVAEGEREFAVAEHLRSIALTLGRGHSLTVVNAQQRGASNAVETAVSLFRNMAFDVAVVMVDATSEITAAIRAKARTRKVTLLESAPCLEAWLLQVHGHSYDATFKGNRARFKATFGGHVFEDGLLQRHFDMPTLVEARRRIRTLDLLMSSFGIGHGAAVGTQSMQPEAKVLERWRQDELDL